MEELRKSFHDIANCLNRISVKSGIVLEIDSPESIDSMDAAKVKEEFKKVLEVLSSSEDSAIEAGKLLSELKKKVYASWKTSI